MSTISIDGVDLVKKINDVEDFVTHLDYVVFQLKESIFSLTERVEAIEAKIGKKED